MDALKLPPAMWTALAKLKVFTIFELLHGGADSKLQESQELYLMALYDDLYLQGTSSLAWLTSLVTVL